MNWVTLAFVAFIAIGTHTAPITIQQVDTGTLTVVWLDGDGPAPERDFYANGVARGKTNVAIPIRAGTYTITLGSPNDYTPSKRKVTVRERASASVTFKQVAPRL